MPVCWPLWFEQRGSSNVGLWLCICWEELLAERTCPRGETCPRSEFAAFLNYGRLEPRNEVNYHVRRPALRGYPRDEHCVLRARLSECQLALSAGFSQPPNFATTTTHRGITRVLATANLTAGICQCGALAQWPSPCQRIRWEEFVGHQREFYSLGRTEKLSSQNWYVV